jgi:phage gpG-like protein
MRLADVELRAKRLGPAFRELRKPFRTDQSGHARGEEGPSGKWPARSPLTEARRRQRNRSVRQTKAMKTIALRKPTKRSTPKRLLGRLPGAVTYKIGEMFIRATSRASFGGAHQFGGTVGRGVKLPQRMFLWLSDKLRTTAADVLGNYVVKGWKK